MFVVNSFVYKVMSLSWLTGPIFDKELRVSSRRRRNYLLRFAYILLLSIFILSIWYSTIGIRSSGSIVYIASRLSQAGKHIITTIVWFQFIAAQVIAIVMLSSSVSDEIHTGTLNVLLTTPISSFQIVIGKLLSKLLQLILLLAISLPLLAIVRVFGGVTWDYIVSSVCITLTAAVLVGTLSLMLSMIFRHAYNVIIVTILGYMLVFGALAGLFNTLADKGLFIFDANLTQSILALINPLVAFTATNAILIQSGVPKFFSWPVHCLIMLALTAVLLAISIWHARKAALGEEFCGLGKLWFGRTLKSIARSNVDNAGSQTQAGSILPVTGSPIVWREMRKGFVGRSKADRTMNILLIILFCLTAFLLLLPPRNNIFTRCLMLGLYWIVMIRIAVFSAGSIAGEKEARTWPIMLVTTLEDKEIIRGKIIAAIRRNIPLLLLYFVLICISYANLGISMLPRILIILLTTVVNTVCSILFLAGIGVYFGVRLKTTTTAVAATVGSYLIMAYLFRVMFSVSFSLLFSRGSRGIWMFYATSIIYSLALGGIGIQQGRCAIQRLRRNIF